MPLFQGINRGASHCPESTTLVNTLKGNHTRSQQPGPESVISTNASRVDHTIPMPSPAAAVIATTQKPFSDFNFPQKKSLIVPSLATSWMSHSGSSRGENSSETPSSCQSSRAGEASTFQPDSRITAPSFLDSDVEAFPATFSASSQRPISSPVCKSWQENLSKFRVKSKGSNIIKLNTPGSKYGQYSFPGDKDFSSWLGRGGRKLEASEFYSESHELLEIG